MSATVETIGELPPYLAAAYREAAERALKLSHEPYEAYAAPRIAPHSPHTRQALNLSGQIGSYVPYMQEAHHQIKQGTRHFPAHYQEYMQPYQEEVVNNLGIHGQKSFAEGFLPELEKRFSAHGPGVPRHPNFSAQAERDIQSEIAAQQQDAMSRGYQHAMSAFDLERTRALEAAELLTRLGVTQQAGQLADIQALRESGTIAQGQEQALMDQAYEDWKEERRHPYDKLKEYFGILQGTPYVPSSYEKREIRSPSDTYHHGDWRHIAENVGLNALGGMLSGHEPSPAIIAAFKNVLPGGDLPSKSSEERKRRGEERKQKEEARIREEEERRKTREQIKAEEMAKIAPNPYKPGTLPHSRYQENIPFDVARATEDRMEANRIAAAERERQRVMDEYRAKSGTKQKSGGDKKNRAEAEEQSRRRGEEIRSLISGFHKKQGGDKRTNYLRKKLDEEGPSALTFSEIEYLNSKGALSRDEIVKIFGKDAIK